MANASVSIQSKSCCRSASVGRPSPGGGITPAHADQYYWPLASDRTITVWIPLQDTPLPMGPLEFYKGSHRTSIGRDLPISDESEARICAEMEAQGFEIDRAAYALGDVSFHAGWTFHRAGANQTDQPRSVMTMIYMDADIRVADPVNAMQQSDLAQWLPGLQPGPSRRWGEGHPIQPWG